MASATGHVRHHHLTRADLESRQSGVEPGIKKTSVGCVGHLSTLSFFYLKSCQEKKIYFVIVYFHFPRAFLKNTSRILQKKKFFFSFPSWTLLFALSTTFQIVSVYALSIVFLQKNVSCLVGRPAGMLPVAQPASICLWTFWILEPMVRPSVGSVRRGLAEE